MVIPVSFASSYQQVAGCDTHPAMLLLGGVLGALRHETYVSW